MGKMCFCFPGLKKVNKSDQKKFFIKCNVATTLLQHLGNVAITPCPW